jgi:hypothetical protein
MHDGIAHDITTGGHDAFAPRPPSETLAAAIPGATIEIVEGCDHVMFRQRPAEFNQRAIRLFAGSRRRRRSITSGGALAITRAGVRRVNPAIRRWQRRAAGETSVCRSPGRRFSENCVVAGRSDL